MANFYSDPSILRPRNAQPPPTSANKVNAPLVGSGDVYSEPPAKSDWKTPALVLAGLGLAYAVLK